MEPSPILFTLVITMNQAGEISLSGPLENKVLCYGLLEVGRDIVANHKAPEQRIVPPGPTGLALVHR